MTSARHRIAAGPSFGRSLASSRIGRIGRIAFVLASLAGLVAGGAGCYKPAIKEGGYACGEGVSLYDQECPSGFSCIKGFCRQKTGAPDSGVVHPPDAKEAGSEAGGGVDLRTDQAEAACVLPAALCAGDASKMCDPICQTGCTGCRQKCSVTSLGGLTCNEPPGTAQRKEGESCDPVSENTPAQTDDCAPGLVCFTESCGSRCARFCNEDKECSNSTCSRTFAPGYKVCDVPIADCNPVKMLDPSRCPGSAQGCYLSSTIPDRVVCDCPFGSKTEGQSCSLSRDCLPGLTCVDATGGGLLHCQIACALTGAVSGCMASQICRSLKGSTIFGYCY